MPPARVRAVEDPGKRERRRLDAATVGLRPQAVKAVEHGVARETLVRPRPLRHARSFGIGLAAAVLAGQPAAGERAERHVRDALGRAERQHLAFVAAVEQRVGVLDERRPAVP